MGIKKREFIKELEAMPENEKGFINLSFGSQKEDPDKLSVWKNQESSSKSSSSGYSRSKPESSYSNSQSSKPASNDTDDLPF